MEDGKIIELYWNRDEKAIEETKSAYGNYLEAISARILKDKRDAEECVSDTYLGAWNSIPPERPGILSAYLARITRNLSLKKLRDRSALKRGGGETEIVFHELEDVLFEHNGIEDALSLKELSSHISRFLETRKKSERQVFIRRYFYFDSVEDISRGFGYSIGKVKMMLKRTRDSLREALEKEGIFV